MTDYYPRTFFIAGLFLAFFGGLLIFAGIMADAPPLPAAYMQLALSVVSFCMSYLYPQFKQKDERMKEIRKQGVYYSYFAILGYLFLFLLLLQVELISWDALLILNVLSALAISTVFVSWVILAKRY
ncbi:permease [Jeotgalibacillus proteolyticus]|uniref:permease n=1 Tax=Jeotgalibacillus proteolyticus TaxID=2082395 RepID=UPI003CF5156F